MAEKENTEEVENIEVKENQEKVLHSNEEYDELNDRYKRVLAEFENFKKRSQKEKICIVHIRVFSFRRSSLSAFE